MSSFVVPALCLMKKLCHGRLPGGYPTLTLTPLVAFFFSLSGILRGRVQPPNACGSFAQVRVVGSSAFGEPGINGF